MGIDGIDNLKNLEKPKYVGKETPESYLKRISLLPERNAYQDELDSLLKQHAINVRDKLDAICRQAMQGGKYGVKVTTFDFDGSMLMEVSPDVPFGEIHYHKGETGANPFSWYDSPTSEYDV